MSTNNEMKGGVLAWLFSSAREGNWFAVFVAVALILFMQFPDRSFGYVEGLLDYKEKVERSIEKERVADLDIIVRDESLSVLNSTNAQFVGVFKLIPKGVGDKVEVKHIEGNISSKLRSELKGRMFTEKSSEQFRSLMANKGYRGTSLVFGKGLDTHPELGHTYSCPIYSRGVSLSGFVIIALEEETLMTGNQLSGICFSAARSIGAHM